jgi:hypothetical protein
MSAEQLTLAAGWEPWIEPPVSKPEIDSFIGLLDRGSPAKGQLAYIANAGVALLKRTSAWHPENPPDLCTMCYGPYSIPPRIAPHIALEGATSHISLSLQQRGATIVGSPEGNEANRGQAFAYVGGEAPPPSRLIAGTDVGDWFRRNSLRRQPDKLMGIGMIYVGRYGASVGFADVYDGRRFLLPVSYETLNLYTPDHPERGQAKPGIRLDHRYL